MPSARPCAPPAPPDRGLGLELMRRLVDDVEVQSGPNGTTVRLSKRLANSGRSSKKAAAKKVARR